MKRSDNQRPTGGVTLPDGGEVYVDPTLDPHKAGAAAYRAGIMSRRGGLPKADMPLERQRPPIPHLEGGPGPGDATGRTMADYGRMERAAASLATPAAHAGPSIIAERPAAPTAASSAPRVTPASLGLAPADLLPNEAKNDPRFREGHGSEFACNQPELAAQYGVVRNGQWIPPQKLGGRSGKATLRPETIQDLEALKRLQEGHNASQTREEEEAEAHAAVADGLGGSAGRIGGVEKDSTDVSDEERKKLLKNAIDQMDAFEFNQWRQLTMRQILYSEEERELIESRLKPLDLSELLQNNVIRQRIPIIPGKYEITLQSYEGQVELALKRLIMMESRSVDVPHEYLLDKHSFMSLAVGLHKINDTVFPEVLDADGVFDDKLFLAKFNRVMKLPLHMLASIGVNLMWFEMRVRKLYSATALGNG